MPNLLGAFLLLLTGISFAQNQPAPVRYYYSGLIGELRVQMDLDLEGERVSGHYYYEHVGVPLYLQGAVQDHVRLELVERDDGVATGSFSGELSSSWQELGSSFRGSWQSPDGRTLPFTLTKAADFIRVQTRQGELIEVNSLFPRFTLPALERVNRWLQARALSEHVGFLEEGQAALAEGSFFNGWWLAETYEIQYYAGDLVSLLVSHDSYTGGAHPNLWFDAVNIWLPGGEAQALGLADLFAAGSHYLERLSGYLIAELQEREAGWVAFGELRELDADRLSVFTVSPTGLTFHFAPYEVGSYAEGPYVVTVPFGVIEDLIDPAGPLGRFMAD